MHFNFQKHQSKQLIQDYVSWRLTHAGFSQWNLLNRIDVSKNSKTKVCLIMRRMAFEFETQYEQVYASFNSFQFEPNDSNTRDIFNTIIVDLFELTAGNNEYAENKESDSENENRSGENCINFSLLSRENYSLKCTWGKIIGLFSLAGSLAIKLYEMNALNLIYCLIDLLNDFVNNDRRVFAWISSQGGWVNSWAYLVLKNNSF